MMVIDFEENQIKSFVFLYLSVYTDKLCDISTKFDIYVILEVSKREGAQMKLDELKKLIIEMIQQIDDREFLEKLFQKTLREFIKK